MSKVVLRRTEEACTPHVDITGLELDEFVPAVWMHYRWDSYGVHDFVGDMRMSKHVSFVVLLAKCKVVCLVVVRMLVVTCLVLRLPFVTHCK